MAEVFTTLTRKSLVQTNILHSPHLSSPLVQGLVLLSSFLYMLEASVLMGKYLLHLTT